MRRNRRLRGNGIKKQRRIIALSLIGITFLFASGYAAFNTALNINAKGNLVEKENTKIGGQKVYLASSGDGLYTDPVEENRYVYKGANPDNYICLESGTGTCSEENLYRIIAKEADGTLKVIKNNLMGYFVWDPSYSSTISGITSGSSVNGTRYSSDENDFCYMPGGENNYVGCKSWGSSTSTYDSTGNTKVTQMPWESGSNILKNLPIYDSYLNVYLNGGKYLTTSSSGNSSTYQTITGWVASQNAIITNNIVEHLFNVGSVKNASSQSLITDVSQESAYKWNGKVGLMSVTDYVRASTNSNCGNVYTYRNTSSCYNNNSTYNWLHNSSGTQWVITPMSSQNSSAKWLADTSGDLTYGNPQINRGVRPTFFLKSTIALTGKGTNDFNVYRIS